MSDDQRAAETVDRIRRAQEWAARDAVRPEQLGDRTPCPDFDVRALLNHLIGSNIYFAASARGEQADYGVFSADNIGEDWGRAFRDTAEAALAAWRAPGVMERPLSFGGFPGYIVAGIHFTELLLHGWDVARATGQDAALPADLCEDALRRLRRLPESEMREPNVFGPPVPVPDDAPVQDRLLGFVGRDPSR